MHTLNYSPTLDSATAMPTTRSRRTRPRPRPGFTLIEVTFASVVLALAILAIVEAQQAFHQQNEYGEQLSTGLAFANEIRELTLNMPHHDPITGDQYFGPEPDEQDSDPLTAVTYYDDLDDFAGQTGQGITFSPPVNALRQAIPDAQNWSQHVTAATVAPDNINGTPVTPGSTKVIRLTVIVQYQPPSSENTQEITRLTWVSSGQ